VSGLSQRDASHLRRIRESVFATQGIGHLSEYVTRHTYLRGRLFSLKGFEFQEAILDDASLDVVIAKPRQVGATEVIMRLALSFLATTPDVAAMLLLPHIKRALHLVKSRYDGCIQNSPDLKALLVPGSDSSSFKQLGSSQLFTGGTWSGDIISDPVDLRICDEHSYMNFENLATSDATMDNSAYVDPRTGLRGIRRNFSTPLVPNLGVSHLYEHSDQKQRLVRAACGHSFWPHYENVVVDGWDAPVIELAPSDIYALDARGLLQSARILCPQCHEVVPQSRLAPEHREWVPKVTRPNVARSGYHVTPFDLPFDASGRPKRTPEWLIRGRVAFEGDLAKFVQHRLGLAYSDKTNRILDSQIVDNAVLPPFPPAQAAYTPMYGLVAGMDCGKPNWLKVGRPLPNHRLDIVWMATLPCQGPDAEDLPEIVFNLLKPFRLQKFVIDQYPYTPSVLKIQAMFPPGVVYACDFSLKDASLNAVVVKEDTQEIKSHRTRVVTAYASAVNHDKVRFPAMPELIGKSPEDKGTLRHHASNIAKVSFDYDGAAGAAFDPGEQREVWSSSGPDHWVLAGVYCHIAAELVWRENLSVGYVPLPAPRPVQVGSLVPKDDEGFRDPREAAVHGVVLSPGTYLFPG
jgi:hypothetical protein